MLSTSKPFKRKGGGPAADAALRGRTVCGATRQKPLEVVKKELGELFKRFKQGVTPKQLPNGQVMRPGLGSVGQQLSVLTNHYRLNINTGVVYRFDVTINDADVRPAKPGKSSGKPPRGPRALTGADARPVLAQLAKTYGWVDRYAYDGAALLLSTQQDLLGEGGGEEVQQVTMELGGRRYKVSLKPTGSVDIGSRPGFLSSESAQVLEAVVKEPLAMDPLAVRTPRGYVRDDKTAVDLGGMYKVLQGFSASLAPGSRGPSLAVDLAFTPVLKDGPLVAQLAAAMNCREAELAGKLRGGGGRAMAAEIIKGMKVETTHRMARMVLSKLADKSARDLKFDCNGKQVSVEQYFKTQYKVNLKYPELPCVIYGGKNAMPMELCKIVKGQRRTQLRDARLTSALIRQAAKKPEERLAGVQAAMKDSLKQLKPGVFKNFKMALAEQGPAQVPARLLPSAPLQYGNNICLDPGNDGEWSIPAAVKLFSPAKWESVAVVCFLPKTADMDKGLVTLIRGIGESLVSLGLPKPKADVKWMDGPPASYDEASVLARLREMTQGPTKPQLFLVVLPDGRGGDAIYSHVKKACDGVLGVPCQCVAPGPSGITKPPRRLNMYCDQLVLSINTKLGGTNHKIAGDPPTWMPLLGNRPVMFLGADVTHPTGTKEGGTSFASVVGSVDRSGMQYACVSSSQDSGQEVISSMRAAVVALLTEYTRKQGVKPEVLVMFRDGVSFGQFDIVLAEEWPQIKKACVEFGGPGYKPAITFATVQKTHNTRLFPADPKQAHRSGNVQPGTCIDSDLLEPEHFSFFLNSHAGIQGTNKAPRYTVLADELGWDADSFQLLSFWLAHCYTACNRATSVPAPVMYADLAAARASLLAGKLGPGKAHGQVAVAGQQRMYYI